jgi:pimeloyl-ACP methyl ester carboxylesterase
MTLATSKLVVKGRPTEVLTTGQGEPLVFLHGGGIVEGFDCLEPLSDQFWLIAPLRPGYGGTDADPPLTSAAQVAGAIRDVLDELGVPRTVLVGHSLGGWLAANFTALFPERVSELVLAAPFGMHVPDDPPANMMAMTPAERYAALTNRPEIWEGRVPSEPDPAFEAARARERESMTRFMPGPFDPELAGVVSQISAPSRLLWGADDRIIPVAHADKWHDALPDASLTVFPATGHLLFHERPEAVEAIGTFVRSCRAAT